MKTFLAFIASIVCSAAFSQSVIRGKLTDQQTGAPLSGATISSRSIFTTSSVNGDFEILILSPGDTIYFSFVGYEPQQVKLSSSTKFLNIALASRDVNLATVTVTGYASNRKLLETAGAIGILKSKDLQRGDNMDIMSALNTLPGVKMEAYSAGNYRIAIRGSLLNNPWGIRNVRIYWNDIPVSSPDGTAQKSVDFDPTIIGSIEVLKGPSGSIYGAGNGGVILIKSPRTVIGRQSIEAGYTGGSYGFSKFHTSYTSSSESANVSASIIRQRYAGYRDNNWGDKDVIHVAAQFYPTVKLNLNLLVTHVTGSLGIAGGLSKSQVDSMPRQALAYTKNNKISVKKFDANLIGLSQVYKFNDQVSNTSSIYGNFQTYDHPFGSSIYYNGYFKESMLGYGARTNFLFASSIGKIKARFNFGGEYQYQHQFENTFTIINDIPGSWPEPGDLFQNDIVRSASKIIFAQAELDLPKQFFVTVGVGYTRLSYDILDLFSSASHTNYSGDLTFPPKISPRIGLVKLLAQNLAMHASMSKGYSPPPVWEINNYDGTLNKNIKPEDGSNIEMGMRGTLFKSKFNFDLTAYQMHLKNAIVPSVRPNGTTAYNNAGSTDQRGLEGIVSYLLIDKTTKAISLLKLWTSYTYNHYIFEDYKTQSFDWSSSSVITIDNTSNKVTGVVPNSFVAGADMESRYGFYFNTTYYYYDKIPLNDANTYFSDAYSLLNLKLGYRKTCKKIVFDAFAGINNALNTHYSSLLLYNADANGVPPQFYNPSPGINYYGGLKIKYNIK